jgi:hypothetical protein
MEKITNTHYLRRDHRVVSLALTINGLSETIKALKNQISEIDWYDADWFMDESEPIYGLAFISFQNYINGSIKDCPDSLKEKESCYKVEQNPKDGKRSKIELIIGLANYAKHKDDGTLHKGTKDILDHFKLTYNNVTHLDKSPIFQGLTLLSEEWDLFQVKNLVTDWRDYLWSRIE